MSLSVAMVTDQGPACVPSGLSSRKKKILRTQEVRKMQLLRQKAGFQENPFRSATSMEVYHFFFPDDC